MIDFKVDAVVIGAGVVGLACARQLASAGLETIVLESRPGFGQGISSRNSEVIHGGLYYSQESLKAELCIEGRKRLYEYCSQRYIPHQKVGKWIVATSISQVEELERIFLQAQANGCSEVHYLSNREIKLKEPELNCVAAFCSPETGIVDSYALMISLLADFELSGGQIVYNSPVKKVEIRENIHRLIIDDEKSSAILAKYVVNSAGLNAASLLGFFERFPAQFIPTYCYAKGNYFSLKGKSPFSRLIYPTPQVGGLGVHFTLDLSGAGRFGPDVEWVLEEGYIVNPDRKILFFEAIKSYWPKITLDQLQPAYAGIRPKLGSKENLYKDFIIQTENDHQIPGLINLLGIESPGLTSCLSIASYVVDSLGV